MTENDRQAKIDELASYQPEQVFPPSREVIAAVKRSSARTAEQRLTRELQALCTRKPTEIVIGEPDTAGWTTDMIRLVETCKARRQPFTLKSGHARTMYLADEAMLDRTLEEARTRKVVTHEPI